MQSGDDEILSAMRRGYSAGDYVKVCERAREALGSDLHISADVMAGFPGESEEAFTNTLDVMREAGLGRVHVFPYSERQGTIAAGLHGKVPHTERVSRASRAIALGRELYAEYVQGFVGREVEVLVETDGRGHTRHYVEAECAGMDNEIVIAAASGVRDGRLECMRRD